MYEQIKQELEHAIKEIEKEAAVYAGGEDCADLYAQGLYEHELFTVKV